MAKILHFEVEREAEPLKPSPERLSKGEKSVISSFKSSTLKPGCSKYMYVNLQKALKANVNAFANKLIINLHVLICC